MKAGTAAAIGLVLLLLIVIIAVATYQAPVVENNPPPEIEVPEGTVTFLEIAPVNLSVGLTNVTFRIHNVSLLAAWQLYFNLSETVQIVDYDVAHNLFYPYHYASFDRTNRSDIYAFCQLLTGGFNTFNGTGVLATVVFNVTQSQPVPIYRPETKFVMWDLVDIPYNMTR